MEPIEHGNLIGAVPQIARAVSKGFFSADVASGAFLASTCRSYRLGLARSDPLEAADALSRALEQHVLRLEAQRRATVMEILRAIRPLINAGTTVGKMAALSHDINADAGRPLLEADVNALVRQQMNRAECLR